MPRNPYNPYNPYRRDEEEEQNPEPPLSYPEYAPDPAATIHPSQYEVPERPTEYAPHHMTHAGPVPEEPHTPAPPAPQQQGSFYTWTPPTSAPSNAHLRPEPDASYYDSSFYDNSGAHLNPYGTDTAYHGRPMTPTNEHGGAYLTASHSPSGRPNSYADETTLLPEGGAAQGRPRPPRYDHEAQQLTPQPTALGRVSSFMSSGQSMLSQGQQMFTNQHEYAEDPFDYVQVPINGDSYALNAVEEADEGEDHEDPEIKPRIVNLFKGNLVLDCPVSQKLMSQYPDHQPAREFTHMRYSAATCDPADFVQDQFTLRQTCYSSPRKTELLIAITIYNEDDILLARTLQGVFNNIRHLCSRSRSPVWGAEAWKKVVVCVIADGREKINPRARALLAALGCYQDGLAKNVVNDKAVVGHIYEYTTMMRVKKVSDTVSLTSENATPVQMLFCLKEKNQKKINSHRWLFQALSPILNPNVVVLLDAGTRPGNKAIYHLWKRFDRNPNVAGACGEIAAMLGTGGKKLVNPIVAAQNFEYKMSNILDKPAESVFGFITVLPGAFSAYRYVALLNDDTGHGPLEKYFKGEKLEASGGIFSANMYLAEDRILCWALVAKRGCNWKLTYVKSAVAHTDVPETLSELVLQRRRWLNGSFFASIYAQVHMFQIWRTSHSLGRKLMFHIEFLYQTIQLVFSWFSLANFFLVFKILANSVSDPSMGFAPGHILGIILTYLYGACVVTTFVLSFGNRPAGTKAFYLIIVIIFAIMMLYAMFAAIYVAVKSIQYEICSNNGFRFVMLFTDKTFRDLLISLLATYLLYVIGSLMMLDPWHILTSIVQYILLSPTYINVFNVYAFCNTHDISWGTKGDTAVKHDLGVVQADDQGKIEVDLPTSAAEVDESYEDEVRLIEAPEILEKKPPSEADVRTDYYATFRSSVVLVWAFMNIALIAVVLNVGVVKEDKVTGAQLQSRAVELFQRAGACVEPITTSSNVVSIYLSVIMWSVAGMAAFKFIVCFIFMWQRIGFHCCAGRRKAKAQAQVQTQF